MSETQQDFSQSGWGHDFRPGDRVRYTPPIQNPKAPGVECGTVKKIGAHAGTVFVVFDRCKNGNLAQATSPETLVKV